jgi:hypothetical protein
LKCDRLELSFDTVHAAYKLRKLLGLKGWLSPQALRRMLPVPSPKYNNPAYAGHLFFNSLERSTVILRRC